MVKQLKIITDQPKSFDIVDIKSIITEYSKTSPKLSKTMRNGEKIDSKSSLYSHTKRSKNFLSQKNVKITKRADTFKSYASSYNFEILNSINHDLQLKNTEFAIKSRIIELLAQLKGFKFVATLVLVFKKKESKDKTNHDNFY